MSKVTFIEGVEVKDHTGKIEFKAKAGETVELNEASAQRWLRRGAAVAGELAPEPEPVHDEEQEPEKKSAPDKKSAAKAAK